MSMRCTIRMILLLSGVITSTLAFQTLKNTIHPHTAHSNDNNYDSQLVQPSFVVPSVQRPFIRTTTSKVRLYAATMEDETTTSTSQNSNNKSGTGKEAKQQQSFGDRIASSSMASAAAVATAAGMYLSHRSID